MFAEIERSGMVRAGVGEQQLSDEIRDLAAEMFGVDRHWHKRIVRAGENTLQPYRLNPPDRVIAADDILFCDLGPIFDRWEADFGRTFVLGDDERKHALCADLPLVWSKGREFFESHPDVTGAQLFDHVVELSHESGLGLRRDDRRSSGRGVPARDDRRRGHRVLHRAGVRQPDAAHRPHRACLPLDPRSAPDRSRAQVRRLLRGAARHPLTRRTFRSRQILQTRRAGDDLCVRLPVNPHPVQVRQQRGKWSTGANGWFLRWPRCRCCWRPAAWRTGSATPKKRS